MVTDRLSSLETIRDEDVYIFNPLFKIRKEGDHAVLHGVQGLGTWSIHLSHAIILVLCDGERTVLDIAKLTRPFVANKNIDDAIITALIHVKALILHMKKTKEEQKGIELLLFLLGIHRKLL
ncbi:MAG: hypothetical protein LBE12_03250 [Planctomycetaceae bacterium]|nr:hypothetical protein [Planctomycetaceae bacterium]